MRCHYEVLAIERDASAGDIKKAFHRQALKWHPDKHQRNGISPDEATERFQEIQNAYEVLSDAHERKWYDEHRDQILRGDDADGAGDSDNDLNLFKYFSAAVYSGFGDDEKGFFSVYGALFEKIDALDRETVATSSYVPAAAPSLGRRDTAIADVLAFYQHWKSYVSQRTFAWVDEYKTTDAPTRQIRRAMEKENKKLRDAAKKAFTSEVRELVEFVCKRDPRMAAYQKQREKERAERQRQEEERKKEKQAAYEAERLAFQQQESERWADDRATSRLAQDHIEEELDRLRRKMDAEVLLCDLCNKTFKSTKQLKNHLTSKKHRDREIELGVVSEFDDIEDALDRELQAELEELRRAKKAAAGLGDEMQELSVDDDESEPTDPKPPANGNSADEDAERERLAAQQLRLEKEQKAAEKRKERKEIRKAKKQEEVQKIVSAAKEKAEKDADDDDRRGRGKKGKRR
ncbi:hypothetical protein P43SY_002081 [Pythium insidiosum]|uniref:Uncharacterized protein n=1 Tax=Pythium insidiosum TaxID=114742 RepID=A0AAD5LSC3_PYTIN|nr:hypothetical protein P43SY_002081 [Pythium insidiosum]